MRRILLIGLLLLLPLLTACGAEPAEIVLTPLDGAPVESAAPSPVLRVEIRTPFGQAVPAVLPSPEPTFEPGSGAPDYVLNVSSRRFHDPACPSVEEMNPANRQDFWGDRDELLEHGYKPCGRCKP